MINALALLPFGPEFAIRSPFIEVSAEATPPGACSVVQLSWEPQPAIEEAHPRYPGGGAGWVDRTMRTSLRLWDQVASSAIRLQHSKTYSDPRAVAVVVGWMQQMAGTDR